MSKGGSPMGGGGFGGQQQQGGFGGGFGGQQGFGGGFGGQQGGFGGGFGGQQGGFNQMPQQQQGFGGGFQPSRQRFNQMPQQQMGYGGGFGGQMQGFGGYGMPQQRQQGFGPDVNNYARPMRDPMQPMVSFPAPQQDFGQSQLAAQDAALRSRGMPTSNEIDFTDPRLGQSISFAQPPRPMTQPMAPQQAGSDAARLYEQFQSAQALQPQVLPAQTQIPEGAQVSLARPNKYPDQGRMPSNPYAQQTRQEDPRMQAMRMMQRMRFGGGGGYDF